MPSTLFKIQSPSQRFAFCVVLSLFTLPAFSQTVDCRNNANCGDPYCAPIANDGKELGCECFDGVDNDGDGKIDQADPSCATYYGLTFIGEGSDCSITPPGANTPFDLIGPPAVSGQNTADTQAKVAAGDVDGNGVPDILITSKWNAEVRLVASAVQVGVPALGGGNFSPGDIIADFRLSGNTITNRFDDIGCGKTANLVFEHEVLIADIEGDGRAEVFAVVSNRAGNPKSPPTCFFLVGLKLQTYGAQGLQLMPGYPVYLGTNRPGIFGIADMDGDTKAEIYLRDRIFAAETGKLLASEGAKLMSNTARWDVDVTAAPVTVDIKSAGADGNVMELIVGPKIYKVPSLTSRSPASPAALTLWRDMNTVNFDINTDGAPDQYFVKLMNDPDEYGEDTHSSTSIADVDKDGFMDVVIAGALNSAVGRTTVFYWNVEKNTVSGFRTLTSADLGIAPGTEPAGTCPNGPSYTHYQNGWIWGTGRVNIGDANGDGKLDFSFIAGAHLYCVTTDAPGTNIIPLWASPRTINDSRSGVLTVTIYDFDNDADPEMVYRDSQELVVIDGATGTVKHWSAICQSHTYTEGPIIADVNGDGATDICVPCNRNNSFNICADIQQQALGEVRLFFSSGNEWLPTRKVWNQPGYHVVNINDDLTLPFPQMDPAIVFNNGACSNGLPGPQTPLNVFLNQIPFLSADGCPVFPAPDLAFVGDDPDPLCFDDPTLPGCDTDGDGIYNPAVVVIPPICGNLNIKAYFNIINSGDLPITDNVPVSFFNGDPTTDPGAVRLFNTTVAINNLQVGQTLQSPTVSFDGPGVVFDLYIVMYNDGSVLPVVLTGSSQNECRIDNNMYSVTVTPDPFTAGLEKIRDNEKCVVADPNVGELRARLYKGPVDPANEIVDYSDYTFQWYYGLDTTNPVPAALGGTNYTISDLPEGDYSFVATNVSKGCTTSLTSVNVALSLILPAVSIVVLSDQTICSPPNGSLEAVVAGGNTGFSFEWFSNAAPLGISTATATNLIGNNYTVSVSRNGCTTTASEVVEDQAFEPDVTATSTPVINCATPASGTVSAEATLGGVPQNDGDYTFNWYFHNIGDGSRGSILPPANGTGPDRTGLTPGFYEVEAINIATQCKSTPFVVEVRSQTVIPTVTISQLAPQTSCDVNAPNGRLQAIAFIGGVAQNPADFTFEWFVGQNTLPANLHAAVSGTNGSIAESVKGGGQSYTVKITSAFQCTAVIDDVVVENVNIPIVTLVPTPNGICDPVIAGTAFSGAVAATVTFDGVTVVDFTNYTFTWYDGSVVTATPRAETSASLSGLSTGYYTLVVERTDLSCTSVPVNEFVDDITILPAITAVATPSTNCNPALADGSVTVSNVVSGATSGTGSPFTFQWYTGSVVDPANLLAGQTNPSIINQQGAIGAFRTVLVTNTNDGCQSTDTKEIADGRIIPLLSLAMTHNSVCDPLLTSPSISFNGTATGTVDNSASYTTPTFVFEWVDNATTNVLAATGVTASQLNNGFYTATVTHTPSGCESAPTIIEVLPAKVLPAITAAAIASKNCTPALADGSVTVSNVVSGATSGTGSPFTFQWYTGSVVDPANLLAGQTNPSIINQQGAIGAFRTVLVTNTNDGCQNTDTKEIADGRIIPLLSLAMTHNSVCDPLLTSPSISFNGTATGTVDNSASYTTPTFVFEWVDNATTNVLAATGVTASQLNNGFYTATVTHTPSGCESAPSIIEVLPAKVLPTITAAAIASKNCPPALADGSVTVSNVVSGATNGTGSPFTFQWYTGPIVDPANLLVGQTSPSLLNQQGAVGAFRTVLVTNTNDGCQNTDTKEIADARVIPLLSLVMTPNSICDPTLTVPFTNYNGEVAATIDNQGTNLLADYVFTWTDEEPGAAAIAFTGDVLIERDSSFYSVKVEYMPTGCESTISTIEVTIDTDLPVIAASATPSTNCDPDLANGGVQVDNIDGTLTPFTGYNFEWFSGVTIGGTVIANTAASLDTLQGAIGKFYTVLGTNEADGCQSTFTVEVADRQVKPVITLGFTPNTFCDPSLVAVGAAGSGTASEATYTFVNPDYAGAQTLTYAWTDGEFVGAVLPDHLPASTTNSITNLAAGFYTATVTITELGCTSDPVSVEVEDELFLPVVNVAITPQTSCDVGNPNGILITTVDEATLPVSQGGPGGGAETAGYDFSYFMDWNAAPNDPSGDPTTGTAVADVVGVVSDLVGNKYYAVRVERTATGCESSEIVYLNESIIIPVVTITIDADMTSCATPNGELEATVGGVEAGYTFHWYDGNDASDEDFVITNSDLSTSDVGDYDNLSRGYYTVVAVDNVTTCKSEQKVEFLPDNLDDIVINGPNILVTPTACADASGSMDATVDVLGFPTTAGFTFEWFINGPDNAITPIDFLNPPTFATPAIGAPTIDPAFPHVLGDVGTFNGVRDGLYTVVVTDDATGCKKHASKFLPFINSHTITTDFNPSTICPYTTGNGDATLLDIGHPGAQNDTQYTIRFYEGGSPDPLNEIADFVPGAADGTIQVAAMTNLKPGIYYLEVEEDYTGNNCSIDEVIVIDAQALPPVLELDGVISANSACDIVAEADGQFTIKIGPDVNDVVPATYSFTADDPANTSESGEAANSLHNITDLPPGTYTVVLTASTGCSTTKSFTVDDVPNVSELVGGNITITDAEYCDPDLEASAKIIVTTISLVNGGGADAITDYDFDWYTDAALTNLIVVADASADGTGTRGERLMNGANGVAANAGIVTIDDYYVVARKVRNVGGNGGVGCFSAPFQAIIGDKTVTPAVSLFPFMDTSCEILGGFEGRLEVEVTSTSLSLDILDGYTNPNETSVYNYNWFSGAAPLPAGNTSIGNDGDRSDDGGTDQDRVGGLGPGTYGLTVTASNTGCQVGGTTTITKSELPLVVANATVVNQILCRPDGSITIGTNDVLVNGAADTDHNNFSFTWYKDALTNAPIINDVVNADVLNITSFPTITAGTYFVKVKKRSGFNPGSGCESAPVRKDILDQHINPSAILTPANDTSCETVANFEGSIEVEVTASGSGPVPPNFTHDWSSLTSVSVPPDGAAYAAGPLTFTDLRDDTYNVRITNNTSLCFVNVSTTITKLSTPIIVTDVAVVNQLICSPDGSLTVTQVDVGATTFTSTDPEWNTDFEFAWFKDNPTSTQLTDGQGVPVAINEDVLQFGINPGDYPFMGAGTYYVTAKRTTGSPGSGCISAPIRRDVLDQHVNPTLAITPVNDTSCETVGNFEGSLRVEVTNPGSAPSATYSYAWGVSNPTPQANRPNATDDELFTQLIGDDATDYVVTVTNDASGCPVTGTAKIQKITVPIIIANATVVNQDICNPDGSVSVNIIDVGAFTYTSGLDPEFGDFEYGWYLNDPTGTELVPITAGNNVLDAVDLPASMGAGSYYVTAKRFSGSPGSGCISAPLRKDVLDVHVNPTISLTPSNDTSCETVGNFEGSILVQVTSPGSAPSATYSYAWDAGNPTPQVDRPNATDSELFNQLIGDATTDYVVRVTNDASGCVVTSASRIQKITVPIIIASASPIDQLICNPDGSITVNRIDVGSFSYISTDIEFADFSYVWYKDDPTGIAIVAETQGNNVLDATDLPATMGAGTYYVTAKRVAGAPGSGCISAPLRQDLQDLSQDPNMSFTFEPNSSCDPTIPNGVLTALAVERDGSTDTYAYTWTLNGGGLNPATIQTDLSPQSELTDAIEGEYSLTLLNTVTGCTFVSGLSLELDLTISLPNIVDVTAIDPLNCFPTGSARVVEVTIGGVTTITNPAQLDAAFDYEWYKKVYPTNLLAGQTNALLPNQFPDSYFVLVRDLQTNCESSPVEVIIDDATIVYPVANIRQSLPQISCDASFGTAELISTADGQDDSNVNYSFEWFPSLDTTGVSFATTSTISNLIAGNYSVSVLNAATNCKAAALFIVPDASPQFLPQLSISTTERTRCDITDGALFASGVPFPADPNQPLNNYPFPYNYTAELYAGDPPADINNPDLGFMANDPLFPTFTSNFLRSGLAEGSYTVRLTDLNTACVTIHSSIIDDGRVFPIVDIREDNPLINCDPLRPNGQLSATADGGRVGGYSFEWYAGNLATGSIITSTNTLIGQTVGFYTVLVRNNITSCPAEQTGEITDGTVKPPAPDASLVQGRTSCIVPNGWVTVDVDGATLGYVFNWYDGNATKATADLIGINYTDRDIGDYTATATDIVTGCVSLPTVIAVPDLRITPIVNILSTPSYCLTPTGSVILEVVNSDEVVLTDITWFEEGNGTQIGIGSATYELFAGSYRAEFISSEGCEGEVVGEVGTEILSYNLVSANSDNSNDFWNIDCIQNFPTNNVKVFNRSGVKVYEADGYNNNDVVFRGIGEKGVYALGNDLPDGTYFYIIDKRNGSKPIVGYLELVH